MLTSNNHLLKYYYLFYAEGPKMKRKRNLFFLIVTTLSLMISILNVMTIKAASVPTTEEVYKAAPEGVDITDYMEFVNSYKDNTINSVKVYEKGSEYGNMTDIIELLNEDELSSSKQLSSIWGKKKDETTEDDNYFDLKKKQTISAWLYFGDKYAYEGLDGEDPETVMGLPDGMAFVIQDDDRGIEAISNLTTALTAKGITAPGQSLGVWGGVDVDNVSTNRRIIGGSAIQNSFALEFDTMQNSKAVKSRKPFSPAYKKDNFFDGMMYKKSRAVRGQHIAWNYPGGRLGDVSTANEIEDVPDTNQFSYFLNKNSDYYYGMNHRGALSNVYLSGYQDDNSKNTDNSWHHFKIVYTPPEEGDNIAKVSYYFNDKNYDGTLKPSSESDQKINQKVDTTLLMNGKNVEKKVRWGFTASTGSPDSGKSTFAVVMQEMPNVANITTDTALYDLSQYNENGEKGRFIEDLDKKEVGTSQNSPLYTVANGDDLRFEYNLNYSSGHAGSGDEIKTVIKLPKNIDYSPNSETQLGTDGNVGQITYSNFVDGTKNRTETISADQITQDADGNNIVKLTLDPLMNENENAKVEFFGKADAAKTSKKVLGEHTSYKSLHFIDDIMSPSFIIADRLMLTTADDADLGTINTSTTNNSVKLNLAMNYQQDSLFDNNGVTLYTMIDDDKTKLNSEFIETNNTEKTHDIANDLVDATLLNAATLGAGDHKVTVYAVDYLGRTSDPIDYNVTVEGTVLKLDIDEDVSFQDVNYQSTRGHVRRKGKWKVKVLSSNTSWDLSAAGDKLHMKGDPTQTMGPMFFRDKNHNDFALNSIGTPVIASDYSMAENQEKDVSGDWGRDDGILLNNNEIQKAGTYTGKITWKLVDSLD